MKNTFFFVWTAVKIINMCCGDLKTTFVYIHHGNQLTFFRQHQFFFVIYSISSKNRNFNVEFDPKVSRFPWLSVFTCYFNQFSPLFSNLATMVLYRISIYIYLNFNVCCVKINVTSEDIDLNFVVTKISSRSQILPYLFLIQKPVLKGTCI